MNNEKLQAIIEGLLFVSGDEGINLPTIAGVLDNEKPSAIKKAITELETKYEKDSSSVFSIQKFNNNQYRLQTKSEYEGYLAKLKEIEQPHKLSDSAVEVLTIIAYQGPITKTKIERIRNADSTYQLQRLRERHLIKKVGKSEENSNANLYEVTSSFYKIFNLENGKDDLPKIDIDEMALTLQDLDSRDFSTTNLTIGDKNE